MKHSHFALAFLVYFACSFNTSSAQTPWYLSGNGTVTNTDFVGSTNNAPLIFKTNQATDNSVKMQLQTTGELGIGTTSPASWLHVTATGTQETFRTDVNSNINNYWKMYRNGIEYGRLFHLSGTGGGGTTFFMHATRGDLRMGSGTSGTLINAFRIQGGSGSTAGYVGIGDYANFDPLGLLHVHQNTASTKADFLMTNATTGITATDGFLMDVSHTTPNVNFRQQENNDMIFYTGSSGGTVVERMRILNGTNNGSIGMGTSTPGLYNRLGVLGVTVPTTASSATTVGVAVDNTQINTSNVALNHGIGVEAVGGTDVYGVVSEVDGASGISAGIYAKNLSDGASNFGGLFEVTGNNLFAENVGVDVFVGNSYLNRGFMSEIDNGDIQVAYEALCDDGADITGLNLTLSNATNLINGVVTYVTNSNSGSTNMGVQANVAGGSTTYGIYADVAVGTCPSGGPSGCVDAAGYFLGSVYTSQASYITSDSKFKTNINPLINGRAILAQLEPKTFNLDSLGYPAFHFKTDLQYGLIAQDVEAILPGLVKDLRQPEKLDGAGNVISPSVDFKAMNYTGLIPFLVDAVNEAHERVDSLIGVINAGPRPQDNSDPQERNGLQIELRDISTIILNQNDPNPFNESTRITFTIAEEIISAKILFTNSSGSIINTLNIEERGASELQVFASDLSSGIYTYTLICDGKVIDSKKMVKQ